MAIGAKNNSRNKKKGKKKLVFAKDKNQAILAIVVLVLFFGNSIYMIVKYNMENSPPPVAQTQQPVDELAQQQEQSLQNIDAQKPELGSDTTVSQDASDIYTQTLSLQGNSQETPQIAPNPISQTLTSPEEEIEIISKKSPSKSLKPKGKMVLITVSESGRSNPFLPASENIVASSLPNLNLLAPPETLPMDSDAGKVMTTTISGILYDKYSPSAIINIEGSDYLVKRGDIINKYKILSIGKTEVIVQLGKNVYKAGVGELLSKTNINYNTIANLNKKFGGNEIQINVKKKGYLTGSNK